MTVSSSSPQVLSHGWITRTDLGLYHTPGSSARQVPRSSPAMAAHKPASQRQHTGEETFSPSGWMKPYDDGERGIWSYPTTETHSAHPRAGARQRSSLFLTTTIAPKNILFSWLLLAEPRIYLMQNQAWHLSCSYPFCQRHLGEVPPPLQSHGKRDCRIHTDKLEK